MSKEMSDIQWRKINEIYENFSDGQNFYGYCWQGDAILNEVKALELTWKENMQDDGWVMKAAALDAFGTALYRSGNLGMELHDSMKYWVRKYRQLNVSLFIKCNPRRQISKYREVLDF